MNQQQALNELQYVIEFTEVYKSEKDIYLREAKCLKKQTPKILVPLEESDLLAGLMKHGFVGFSPQYGGLYTYYYHEDKVAEALKKVEGIVSDEFVNEINDISAFWEKEKTLNRLWQRFHEKFPNAKMGTGYWDPGVANADGRLAGTCVDLDKLIRLGLPGLRDEINYYREKNGDSNFYQALLMTVDTISDACAIYEQQARTLADTAQDSSRKKDLTALAEALHNIQNHAPATFLEGLQLFWIYAVISDLMNYGRMDVYLGDLYVQDIEKGILDEEEAIRLMSALYRRFIQVHKIHDTRVIIGGKGRRNEKNADALAMIIMETSRRIKDVVPQLTLRYYNGMSKEVYDKALQVNAEGTTFPIIYSDETNIPAVMKVYDVPEEEAERYLPFGCGEYVLEGLSTGTPNNGVNLLKALELTLQDGFDYYHNQQVGIKVGDLEKLDTFEKLWDAYVQQLQPWVEYVAWHKKFNYDVAAEQAGYLHISLLMDDCIARGKGLLNGGVRYMNASSEIFGIISTADSFTAIKKLVYEERAFTLTQLAEMLRKDFQGYEKEHRMLLNAPKYGNDDPVADEMAQRVFNHIAEATVEIGKKVGINKYNIVSVNNSMSAEWGAYCIASPCGRRAFSAMSNGNGPSIGADKNGITALLNSMSKFNPEKHVGVINNVRFTKELFKNSYDKVKAVITTFLENNGVQLNISVVGRDDLENAMKHPEKYQNLIVRVGGFSARFVELSPVVQKEILMRTTYNS